MKRQRTDPPVSLKTVMISVFIAQVLTVLLVACGEESPTQPVVSRASFTPTIAPAIATVDPVPATATPNPAPTSTVARTQAQLPTALPTVTNVPANPTAKTQQSSPVSASVVGGIDQKKIPLGDGKISKSPQKGYIFSCPLPPGGGGGAQRSGEWIQGTTWDATRKTQVRGDVKWPNAMFQALLENTTRKITGNGLPSHNTGTFPVASNDPAFQYDRNPNSIKAHPVSFSFPAMPTEAKTASCVGMGMIGIALSGVAIFNGLDAEGRDAVAHEIQDKCNGHPEREGTYHYHSFSPCSSGLGDSQLFGYSLDGFGIFSLVENGKEITDQDLDECHGHIHEIEWDGKKVTMYHYHLTREYPYTLGCYRGTPLNIRPGR